MKMGASNLYLAIFLVVAALPAIYSMTNSECDSRYRTCLTNFMGISPYSTGICTTAQAAIDCVDNLDCDSIMYYLMSYRQISSRLQDLGITSCDIGPLLQDFPTQCQNYDNLRSCVVAYTDRIISHTLTTARNDEHICEDLNDYVECQLDWNGKSCNITEDSMRDFVIEERVRMNVPECEVDEVDASTKDMANFLLVALSAMFVSALRLL